MTEFASTGNSDLYCPYTYFVSLVFKPAAVFSITFCKMGEPDNSAETLSPTLKCIDCPLPYPPPLYPIFISYHFRLCIKTNLR